MQITLPKNLVLSGGSYNAQVHDWRLEGSTSYEDQGDIVVITVTAIELSIDELLQIATDGGDVSNCPTFQVMPSNKLSENVPETLPNATWTDEEGVVHNRTWETWRDDNHPIRYSLDESQAAFGLNPYGTDLKGSEIKIIADLGDEDIQILDATDYKALMATPDWTEPEA